MAAGTQINSSNQSLRMSRGNTLIRRISTPTGSNTSTVTSGSKLNLLGINDSSSEREWVNFARSFWYYYPSLQLISESSKYCKTSVIRLLLDLLPRHIQGLAPHSGPMAGGSMSFGVGSPSATSPVLLSSTGSVGRGAAISPSLISANNNASPTGTATPSLSAVLSTGSQSQTKLFTFESFLSMITCTIYQNDLKYMDLIESTIEMVVADIITQILGNSPSIGVSEQLLSRLRDLAFYYFRPIGPRALNTTTWYTLRLSISDQWSLILGQLSRITLSPVSNALSRIIGNNPTEEQIPIFKGIRWVSLNMQDNDKITEVEKLLGQMLFWIEGNKKNNLRLAQLESLDGMLLSMSDFTMSTGIVEKMKAVYKRAEKMLKHDDFEERSLKLMTTILTRGPNSIFDEEYESVLKRLWKTVAIQKKRDFSLECVLRLLQGKFVPPRKITGLQANLSANSESPGQSIAAQLQQRMERVYENSGSYLYAGLAHNRAKMIPRLHDIISTLYGKKQVVPKVIECIDLLTAITVHFAVHSLKLLTDTVLPCLFSNQSLLYHVVALRTLSIILDPSDVFWNTSPSANPNMRAISNDIIYVRKEEIQLTLETFLTKSFKYCEEQSGGDNAPVAQDPLALSTQFEPTISLYSLISDQTAVHKFESETTVEAIKRWYDVCTKSTEQREKEFADQYRASSNTLANKVLMWENTNALPGAPVEQYPMKRKTPKRKIVNPELLELFKETIRCVTFMPKSFIVNSTLHKLVLHEEEEIAMAASHAIQVVMCDHPELRTTLVQGYTSLILQYIGKDHVALQTLLSQLLGLIDLWNERSFIESRHSSVPLDSSFYPPKMLQTEIEAIGFVHLTSPNPQTRMISLQLIRSISGIRNTETTATQVASVLHTSWRTIMQRARHQLLLDNSYGIDKDIKLGPNDDLPTIEEVTLCTHDRLWAFVLAEIGREAVEHDCIRTLSKTRGIILGILAAMPPPPTEQTTDEAKRHASYTLRHLWVNCHALMFSICGISSSYPLRPTPGSDPIVDEMINFEHGLQTKVTNYLPNFWAGLLSDAPWIREKLSFICGLLHWRLLPCFIDSLNNWWTANKNNKKLARVRVDLSNIFRRISQHRDFRRALMESADLIQVFVQFINQIEPIFGDATKLPSLAHSSYFADNAMVVYNFCNSLYTPTPCALEGPVRKSLISSIRSIPWTVGERYKTFRTILQWSGHPLVANARMQLEGLELNKRLAKKDSIAREEERLKIDAELTRIRTCSRLAAEAILSLGTLFEQGLLVEVMPWVIDSEIKGNRILRWVLSYHFDESYFFFLNRAYTSVDNNNDANEAVLFLHSVYDQYLPIPSPNPPTLGISEDIYQYYYDKALEERAQEQLENEPVTSTDRNFSRRLTEIGSTLLFLSCLNLLHPTLLARIRSFDLIARLAPCAFGLLLEEDVSIRAILLPKRQSFASQITPTCKQSAIEVSEIASQACAEWTERFFEEAFARYATMSNSNRRWTVQLLLPWCSNISLNNNSENGRLTRNTPGRFLMAIFKMTELLQQSSAKNDNQTAAGGLSSNNEILPELIELWLALARRETGNLTTIVNFLIKKGVATRDSMRICKLLILHIYRLNPNATLEPLVFPLSYAGVIAEKRSESIAEMTAQQSSNNLSNDMEKRSAKAQSAKVRETCVKFISDLISDNLRPIIPHLHILLNYSLLRIDSSVEGETLVTMVNVLLSALRNSMYGQMSQEPEERRPQFRSVLKSIDTIVTSLRLPTFQIKFNFHDGKKETDMSSLNLTDGHSSLTGRRNLSSPLPMSPSVSSVSSPKVKSPRVAASVPVGSPAGSTTPGILLASSKDDVIEHRNEMIKWCNGYIYVEELITVLCKYCELLTPVTVEKWEAESLLWIKNYKDPRISIKSCQTYRSIIHCQQMLPDTQKEALKITTLKRQKSRWASSVEHLVSLLYDWTEGLDAFVVKVMATAPAEGSSNRSGFGSTFSRQLQAASDLPESYNITLCVEILLALKQISQSKNIDEISLASIFWSAAAFLPAGHRYYEPLYVAAIGVLNLLVIEQKVLDSPNSSVYIEILRKAKEVSIPRGIQYHLFKGILMPSTEEMSSPLIIAFFGISDNILVDPAGSPLRYLLPVLALTPWLHNKILTSKSSIVYKEHKIIADRVASDLASLLADQKRLPQFAGLSDVFKKYSSGGFNSNPDDFLYSVLETIRSACIPEYANQCADLIANMLDNSLVLTNSILKTVNCLLKNAPINVIPMFKNIIKIACDVGSSSPFAGELIHLVTSVMKTEVLNSSNLPPMLTPFDKSPSEIIKMVVPAKVSHRENKRGKGHRRNKSGITDHPSLKERAVHEKKNIPAATPKFSNMFGSNNSSNSSTTTTQQAAQQQQQQQHSQQQLQEPTTVTNMSTSSMTDDYEFEFGDEEELREVNGIIQESITISMKDSLWRASDEYNVYLDDMDEENIYNEGLEDLKDGLDGIDTNLLLNKLNSTQSLLNITLPNNLQMPSLSSANLGKSILSSSNLATISRSPSRSKEKLVDEPTSSTAKPIPLAVPLATVTTAPTSTTSSRPLNKSSQQETSTSEGIDSLRDLLMVSSTGGQRTSDSYQIDQILSNLKDLDDVDLDKLEKLDLDGLGLEDSSPLHNTSFLTVSMAVKAPVAPAPVVPAPQLTGIRAILSDPKKRRAFVDFLKKQHFQKAVNDVCFVEVVQDFKTDVASEGSEEIGGDGLVYLMKHIVEGFVAENARHSISVTEKVRENVITAYQDFITNGNMIDPTIFDVALDMVIKALEEKSILDEFLKSTK
ncbi:hypothetical protein SAMD00019534_090170 [Acytostelium subglobosum LB1]|uniref:hypothetical protein n=1 Tax=Acytostelium subglobosum LB1 TaxID=1410327 RepID=UPI000644E93F|nr:hypothetical protein SAMD00019534_090170 [Acytostelium subglobosum LB1]GAM25842.1 hypothetical protein SAMD00019534_090170 [Acytostelium subglobosum LB1]|eukprot:XP_012751360.1 hypothetical protein SAMD00019534_090170 [Acytostelium subglobosum LB1]